jgi:NAD+ diphosphatase
MLHDIAPAAYDNEFSFLEARLEDNLVVYRGKTVLVFVQNGVMRAPKFADFSPSSHTNRRAGSHDACPQNDEHSEKLLTSEDEEGLLAERLKPYVYLFTVDNERYFMADLSQDAVDRIESQPGWEFISLQKMVDYQPKVVRFALMVAHEYWNWYESSQYCGRCGAKTKHDKIERMMRCPDCGLMIFPKVFPAVIVGITRSDGKVLATRYAGRPYANYALVAGYCEMGETVEQTVHREVMEEVGLRVKNLRYYKSQPWPDSSSLLLGFFCELDGSSDIVLDEHELSFAEWVDRDQLLTDNDHSLTREMMGVLREHRETDYCITQA